MSTESKAPKVQKVYAINQPKYKLTEVFLGDLLEYATCYDEDQSEVNMKRVDKLVGSFQETGVMIQLPIIAELEGVRYNVSGRHRTVALDEMGAPHDSLVKVLLTTVSSVKELTDLITTSNGSRSMNAAEKKTLSFAAEYGMGLTYDSVIAKLYDGADIKQCMTLAIMFRLMDSYDLPRNTALSVAKSLVTKLVATKVRIQYKELADSEGVLLPASVSKSCKLIETVELSAIEQLIELVTNWDTEVFTSCAAGTDDGDSYIQQTNEGTYLVKLPANLQRVSAQFVRQLMVVMVPVVINPFIESTNEVNAETNQEYTLLPAK